MSGSGGRSKWCCTLGQRLLRLATLMAAANLTTVFGFVAADLACKFNTDCLSWPGYICHNSRCVCDPEKEIGLFSPCPPLHAVHGNKCRSDADCNDFNLVCAKMDKTCKCRRGYVWDVLSKRCYKLGDDEYGPSKIGTVSDLVSTLIFVLGIGAMMYLLIKLFCNCSKLWRRGNSPQRAGAARGAEADAQCVPMNNAPGAWVASYRVIGSLEHSPSSQFSGRNAAVPPYLLLPTPGAAPPPYEEALKHKVILSSYPQPPPSPLSQAAAPSSPAPPAPDACEAAQHPGHRTEAQTPEAQQPSLGGSSS